MSKFEYKFQVAYADTDAMVVMHHAAYFRYLEQSRIEWLRELGLDYKTMEREGYFLPLRHASIEYMKPLKFDDAVTIALLLEESGRVHVTLRYELYVNEVLMAKARTEHVLCQKNAEGKLKPCRIPEEWRKKSQWQPQNEPKSSM